MQQHGLTIWLSGTTDDLPPMLGGFLEEGGGLRATMVCPAGGGKTFMGMAAAEQMNLAGPILLLGPNPAYLNDALTTWAQHCSRQQATVGFSSAQRSKNPSKARAKIGDARTLASWIAQHPGGLVAAPYTRPALNLIQQAHRQHALPAWDQMVIEEAHRIAAEPVTADSTCALVHFDDFIPGRRRLYLTATPHILPTLKTGTSSRPIVAIDQDPMFGHVVSRHTRTQLVRSGAVSPYRIELIEISYQPREPFYSEPYARLQAASYVAADSIRRNQLRRVLSVHATKGHALNFATNMAARMGDDIHITAPGEPKIPRHPTKPALWCATSTMPAPDKIDALILADPRLNTLQAVDALSALLRQHPEDVPELTLILPAPRPPEQDHLTPSAAPAYEPIERFLAALWAHDPDYAQHFRNDLAQPGTSITARPASMTPAQAATLPRPAPEPTPTNPPADPGPRDPQPIVQLELFPPQPALSQENEPAPVPPPRTREQPKQPTVRPRTTSPATEPAAAARPHDLWSGLHATVTHTGLLIPYPASTERRGKDVIVTLDTVRTVMVLLSAHDPAGLAALQAHFAWPVCEAPAMPERDFAWKVVFNTENHTFEGFYNESPDSTDPIVQAPTPTPIDDAMWQMLEQTTSVVLATGLTGDPTAPDIRTGMQNRLIHAALVEAVFR